MLHCGTFELFGRFFGRQKPEKNDMRGPAAVVHATNPAVERRELPANPIDAIDHFDASAGICNLRWTELDQANLLRVAQTYYYFSIQFRENLHIACDLYPDDTNLQELEREECNTANLSPWPGVALPGEKMNHDEFMRRLLDLRPARELRSSRLDRLGHSYLESIRKIAPEIRAMSIASYEDGGLERVFRAFLRAPDWGNPALEAFRHFLVEHIRFDHDPEHGHGALSRHLALDERVIPLWAEYEDFLIRAVPELAN